MVGAFMCNNRAKANILAEKNTTSEHQREYATRVTNGSLELLYDLLSMDVLQYQIRQYLS